MGLGWQEHMVKAMKVTAPLTKVTTKVVSNLGDIYASLLSQGYKKPVFTGEAMDENGKRTFKEILNRSKMDGATVRAFLVNLQRLAVKGEIDRWHYDPIGAAADEKARAKLHPSALAKIGSVAAMTGRTMGIVMVGAAVVAVAALAFVDLPKPQRRAV